MDLSNLKTFLADQAPTIIIGLMVAFGVPAWKKQKWLELISIVGGGTILTLILKGASFADFFKGLLKWVGVNL